MEGTWMLKVFHGTIDKPYFCKQKNLMFFILKRLSIHLIQCYFIQLVCLILGGKQLFSYSNTMKKARKYLLRYKRILLIADQEKLPFPCNSTFIFVSGLYKKFPSSHLVSVVMLHSGTISQLLPEYLKEKIHKFLEYCKLPSSKKGGQKNKK